MASLRILVTIGAMICVLFLMSSCSAKPLRSKRMVAFKNMMKPKGYGVSKRGPTKECQEIMGADDYKKFSDEIAYAYLNSGNINALDNLLAYMVDMKCLTIRETLNFRKELTMLYNIINKDDYEYDLSVRDVHEQSKRNVADDEDDYVELENLLMQLAVINLEDEKANDLLHFMTDYIVTMAENNQISVKEANKLLRKSYQAALINMEHSNAEVKQHTETKVAEAEQPETKH